MRVRIQKPQTANGFKSPEPSPRGRLFRGRLAFLAVSAVQKALPLLILPFLTSTLGPEKYGEVAVLISCFTLASMTFGFGLETITYRYARLGDAEAKCYIGAAAFLQRFLPILSGLVVGCIVYFLDLRIGGVASLNIALAVLAASIYCSAWQFPTSISRINDRLGKYFFYALSYSALLAAFKVFLVVTLDLGVQGWVLADIAGSCCLFVLTFRDFLPYFRDAWSNRRVLKFGASLRWGSPLVVNAASQWITGSLDRILIASLLGASAAGQYALAAQVVTVGAVVITELTKYIQPHLAPMNNQGARDILVRVAPKQILLVSIVCLMTALLGAFMAPVVFGPEFVSLGFLSALMSAPLILTGLNFLGFEYMSITRGKTRSIALIGVLTAILSVLLNMTLLPHVGTLGSICTLAVTSLLMFLVVWVPIMRSDLGLKLAIKIFWPAATALVFILVMAWMVA